jgi:hypothetical protein
MVSIYSNVMLVGKARHGSLWSGMVIHGRKGHEKNDLFL